MRDVSMEREPGSAVYPRTPCLGCRCPVLMVERELNRAWMSCEHMAIIVGQHTSCDERWNTERPGVTFGTATVALGSPSALN